MYTADTADPERIRAGARWTGMDRVIVDTDTASDDALALLLAVETDRLAVEAVTVVGGNVPFDREVENAKYTLSLADAADTPVYEGARGPLTKDHEHAAYVHGEGGLGRDLEPDTGIASAEGFAPDEIVRRCRASPGEVTLLCIGPLTNLALAYARDRGLPDLVDEVWVMGGAVNCRGNVTPAAEYNFWVDPDAAKRVCSAFDVTLVDWGLARRDSTLDDATVARIIDAETAYAAFFETVTSVVREANSEGGGLDGITQPDGITAALLAYPELRERVSTYSVDVDERAGLTRGYTSVDVDDVTDAPASTRVVESADPDLFADVMVSLLCESDPDAPLD